MKKFLGLGFVAVGLWMGVRGIADPVNVPLALLGVLGMIGGLTAVWSYEREARQ